MSLILTGNSSTLTVDSTSGITFPNASLQTVAAQTGPAFSASQTTQQSIPNNANTKIQFQTKTFDTASCFSTSTYRFTPNVAGYYQINGAVAFTNFISSANFVQLYKNGVEVLRGQRTPTTSSDQIDLIFSGLVYLNGSTDYVELYCFQLSGSARNIENNPTGTNTYFQGFLARVA